MPYASFQYISCYCLSVPLWGGNTQRTGFQYISCYCLSSQNRIAFRKKIRFQYISCYCLSDNTKAWGGDTVYFNTSHVTVYLRYFFRRVFFFADFNTSHVTVYRCRLIRKFFLQVFQYISCYCLSNELTPFYIFLRI